jgi:hypothetical protein
MWVVMWDKNNPMPKKAKELSALSVAKIKKMVGMLSVV